jgi:hypothetical protein
VACGDDWRRYPFELVAGDAQFRFPAAEANHPDCESDTWFLAGELAGDSGRRFAFLTIFNKNRPGESIVADFYTFALFDLDNGTYGTYTDYDMPGASLRSGASPKLSVADDHLDMTYESAAGTAVWRTCRDERDELVPYTYEVEFVGTDRAGDRMRLDLHVTPSRAPVPLGCRGVQRKDRVLRPGRHVLLLPDTHGDDGDAAVGIGGGIRVGQRWSRRQAVVPTGRQQRRTRRRYPLAFS